MGVRGEVFSSRVSCEGRSYFFNVKENRMGDLFLAIVESKPNEAGDSFERRSVVVFKENMQEFLKAFEKSLDAMEKAQAGKPARRPRPRPADGERRDGERQYGERHAGERHAGERRDDERRPARRSGEGGAFSLLPDGAAKPKPRVHRAKPKTEAAKPAPAPKPAPKRLKVKRAESD